MEKILLNKKVCFYWGITCIDYHKLNATTRKDHFPFPFIDQMGERLARHKYYCFLDGYSGFMSRLSRLD
jgi:hypothetical protein